MMQRILFSIFGGLLCSLLASQNVVYTSATPLDGLNDQLEYVRLPWISADGLRLYYSFSPDTIGGVGYASRDDIDSPFVYQDHYASSEVGNACWLTPDELTMYYMIGNMYLRKVTRSFIGDQFGEPVVVTLLGAAGFYGTGPSLTPDGTELYIRDFVTPGFRRFIQTGIDTFTVDGLIDPGLTGLAPGLWSLGSGKLDHTGTRYYFSADQGNGHRIFRISRNSLSETFGEPQQLEGGAFANGYDWVDAAVAGDETQMVLVGGTLTQQRSDLYLAMGSYANSVPAHQPTHITVWPNPASEVVHFRTLDPTADMHVLITDMIGRSVSSSTVVGSGNLQYDVSSLPEGIYLMVFQSGSISNCTILTIDH